MKEIKNDLLCGNLTVQNGILYFAGVSTEYLAGKYGTPLYVMDEDRIRARIRTYKTAVASAFPKGAEIYYASKAASFKDIYRIAASEGIGVDVVSCGEIHTAEVAGFPLEKAMFHSNNKTDRDIAYAIDRRIGHFAVDNEEELIAVNRIAAGKGIVQPILLRITPGIDPHTYEAISTGKVDSKFGSAIETGQAERITRLALTLPHVRLDGFHCHVGSQVFDSGVYLAVADIMLSFIADIRKKTGYAASVLDLGGGYGVRYTADQPEIDIAANIKEVGRFITGKCRALAIDIPKICMEPGRSIVADAGITLYTVGSVKRIPGFRNYVSVDGGMTDNLRHALYGADYTLLPAMNCYAKRDMLCSVVGRCCESGDIIAENIPLPSGMKRGDLLACLTTGAYHYAMSSNYNRVPRPATVMLQGGRDRVSVKRETLDDLIGNDI